MSVTATPNYHKDCMHNMIVETHFHRFHCGVPTEIILRWLSAMHTNFSQNACIPLFARFTESILVQTRLCTWTLCIVTHNVEGITLLMCVSNDLLDTILRLVTSLFPFSTSVFKYIFLDWMGMNRMECSGSKSQISLQRRSSHLHWFSSRNQNKQAKNNPPQPTVIIFSSWIPKDIQMSEFYQHNLMATLI